jgi:hypothetical protein
MTRPFCSSLLAFALSLLDLLRMKLTVFFLSAESKKWELSHPATSQPNKRAQTLIPIIF